MDLFVQLFPAVMLAAIGVVHHFVVARPLQKIRRGVTLMERGYPEALLAIRGPRQMTELARSVWSLGREVEARMRGLVEAEQLGLGRPADDGPAVATPGDAPPGAAPVPGLTPVSGTAFAPAPFDSTLERLRERCFELERGDAEDLAVRALARDVWASDVEIAARHGDLALRSRLDDAALRVLDRPAYDDIVARLTAAERSPVNRLALQKAAVQTALVEHGIEVHALQQRVKHVAGIWRKMTALGLPFEQIQDVFGLRVVVADVCECYRALAVLHHAFEPQLFSFDDYIAHPKPSGYRSLHTHLLLPCGLRVEVQIRTLEMHRDAEGRGSAGHWRYKEHASERVTPASADGDTRASRRVA